jgi:tetratricopeptide (TPR) repeat protein
MHLGVLSFRSAQERWAERERVAANSVEAAFLEMQGQSMLEESRERFGEAHRLYPRAFENRLNLGFFHLYRGTLLQPEVLHDELPSDPADFEEAARWFVLAEESSPGSFRAHFNMATALARAGRVEQAVAEFERMAKEDTERTTIYAWPLSDLYRRLGRTEEALGMLAKIDALEPGSRGLAALRRAEVLVQARRFPEAKAALDAARAALGAQDVRPDVYMARLLAATGVPENLPALRALWTLVVASGYRPGPKDRAVIEALR